MRKFLIALLLAALAVAGCAALAEEPTPEPEIETDIETEIVALEEDSVAPQEPDETPEATEAPAATPAPNTVHIGFEDGFALQLPEGWRYHATTEEMAETGVVYCLSDAQGTGWLYIQNWDTDCADMNELKELIDRTAEVQTSGVYNFNGTDFVVYDLTEGDVSCCAALIDGRLLNLVFTPQSDAGFMAVAAQILNTFEIL